MKRFKLLSIFLVLFLVLTNYSYASQQKEDNSLYKAADNIILTQNDNHKTIKIIEPTIKITKEQNIEKQPENNIILSSNIITKEISVTDYVYDKDLKSPSATLADLRIISLEPGTQPFEVGEDAHFEFTIANYGESIAMDTLVWIYVDDASAGFINIGGILGGYGVRVGFNLNGVPEGFHKIKLNATTTSLESIINNNSISDSFLWLGVPDLVVSSFETVSGSTSFKTDEEIEFKFSVTNEGTGNARGTIDNSLIIGGSQIANFPFTDLNVGYITTIRFKVTFSEPGNKHMIIQVNPNVTIWEYDVINNVAATTVTISPAPPYLSYGWPNSEISIKPYSYNSSWQPPMDAAISSWNNAGAEISFYKDNSSDNTITVGYYEDEYNGQCQSYVSGSRIIKFEIRLNSRAINNHATNFSNYVQSIFVHELGHTIWLADNPYTTNPSIMKYSTDNNTVTEPQTYDINNVKAKY